MGNIQELAEKIEWVITHSDEAFQMGMRARNNCIRYYSWNAVEKTLTGLFSKFEKCH
jgi:glycosyltransferase involved in cell wall biosynthesis